MAANSDPLRHLRDSEHLWIEADYCQESVEYGTLDDEVHIARQLGQAEQEIRAWLMERLNRLAGA